jgi:hypothetical protein
MRIDIERFFARLVAKYEAQPEPHRFRYLVAIAQSADHSGQLVPGDRRCSITVEAIGPGRGPR